MSKILDPFNPEPTISVPVAKLQAFQQSMVRLGHEIEKLMAENADLRKRLSQYETPKPSDTEN